jgi:hypothetical protein
MKVTKVSIKFDPQAVDALVRFFTQDYQPDGKRVDSNPDSTGANSLCAQARRELSNSFFHICRIRSGEQKSAGQYKTAYNTRGLVGRSCNVDFCSALPRFHLSHKFLPM